MTNVKKYSQFIKENIDNITSYDYEYVKASTLWEYKEFDRTDRNKIDKIKDILEKEGFNQPLILQYSPLYKTSYLTEGNHRLKAAIELGIEYIPTRVTIDGGESKTAKKTPNQSNIINPKLPSELGIESYDKNYNLIDNNTEDVVEDIDYNTILSQYKDIDSFKENSDGSFDIEMHMKYWNIYQLMDDDYTDLLDAVIDNNKETFFKNFNDRDLLEFMGGDYFSNDMLKKLNIEGFNYKEQSDYFYEEFIETPLFKTYIEQIKDIVFNRYKKENLSSFSHGGFETTCDGRIDWLYNLPNNFELYNIKGIIIRHELIECYPINDLHNTKFIDVLRNVYEESIGYNHEWKLNTDNLTINPKEIIL
jgi:hypothetical protein